jgi:ketosteroid isomerase-like protein
MRVTLVSGRVDAELERTIRDAYAAFAEGDIESLRDFFHEDVIYVNPPYAMEAGTREGRDAVEEIWNGIYSLFEFETVEVLEIAEAPRGVLVVLRYRGRGKASGAPVDVPMAHVLEHRDGRVARLAWYGTRDEAAEAAGLQP